MKLSLTLSEINRIEVVKKWLKACDEKQDPDGFGCDDQDLKCYPICQDLQREIHHANKALEVKGEFCPNEKCNGLIIQQEGCRRCVVCGEGDCD